MRKEKVLIVVKTYPALSSSYVETVCTAGIREDGSWIRIYPVVFRKLDDFEKYRKFDWVEIGLERNLSDPRPESYKKKSDIRVLNHLGTESNWYLRNEVVLERGKVFTSFDEIIVQNKSENKLSLATFRPTEIVDFRVEAEKERVWDEKKLRQVEAMLSQGDLFSGAECFKVVNKLPYKFRYVFLDDCRKRREIMITDWEIGALYWNCLKRYGSEQEAIKRVKSKYLENLTDGRDIHFFVGTTLEWDKKNAPNPFTIIGVYSPPMVLQQPLF